MSDPATPPAAPPAAPPATPPTALGSGGGNPPPSAPPPSAPPSGTARPDYIPEKFWDPATGAPKVDQLGAAYVSLEKQFSQKRELKPLSTDATDEQKAAYYADLRKMTGAPEKPEGYGLAKPEGVADEQWDKAFADSAAAIAHKHGLSPDALKEFAELYNGRITAAITAGEEKSKTDAAAVVSTLNKEWGADAPLNWAAAQRGAIALGIDIKKSPLGNDPDFIRAALTHDRAIRESNGLHHGEQQSNAYDDQMNKIRKGDDYLGKNGPDRQRAAGERLKALFDAKNQGRAA